MRRFGFKQALACALRCFGVAAGGWLCALLIVTPARADFYSPKDGYGPGGGYQVHVEIAPYLWLPATQTDYTLGPEGGVSGSASTGVPTLAQLKDSLHGAFMGYTLLRYGPWSAELDFEWVDASGGKSFVTPAGTPGHLSLSSSYVRIAPGFGYQVFNGPVGSVPVTIDARVGFAALIWSSSATTDLLPGARSSHSGTFVQPWLGTRIEIYPAPRWRIDVSGLVQGFGVAGGSWGWGASAIAGYGVTNWMTIMGGIRALRSSRSEDISSTDELGTRSIATVAYGPVLGIGLRF